MSIPRHHTEWLSLIPVSGGFLSLPVLLKEFPQGLDAHDPELFRLLRQEYADWRLAVDKRSADPAPQRHWVKFVLQGVLDLDSQVLLEGQAIPQTLQVDRQEANEFLRPSLVVAEPETRQPRLLVQVYPPSQDLTSYVAQSSWKSSPDTRMTELLHGTGVRLGLVTNGEHWMLVDAPPGETTSYASWFAPLWLEEPITLRAFRTLLSAHRFFNVSAEHTLEALLTESAKNQQEVTDQLGLQVRKAVEVLIHSLDRADQDFGRALLADVSPEQLYESALTVMMRLVFLFCAEERELIPSKPFPVFELNYSVSTISKQLRELADQHGEELLERRYDAWPRLLAAFRAVYGGVRHNDVHLPAYGGSLFDPDRFPFLEGRQWGTSWRVAGGGWRDSEQGDSHGGEALSGTRGVAAGDGFGGGVLSGDQGVSEGRTVRDDQSDSPVGGVDPGEHRRGTGARVDQGVSPLSQHRPGLPDGTGNTPAALSASRPADHPTTQPPASLNRPHQPHALRPPQSPRKSPVTPSPTTHHSPPTTLPVNNRTILHLLESLQYLQTKVPGSSEKTLRRISFRSLDIEQIGHVYEGLLDHTAKRAAEPFLGLAGSGGEEPEIPLAALEQRRQKGEADLLKFLKDETGKTEKALKKSLEVQLDDQQLARFRTACQGDTALWQRVEPLAGLVRLDSFGYPVVIPQGSVFVTAGTDRRSSGTHYTPRSLTEPIVQYTLEPLVYVGPAEGLPKPEWKLKSAKELLDLKICDMACGSGAFLVQAARYMAERLLEAWDQAKAAYPQTPGITPEGSPSTGNADESLIPDDAMERKTFTMRIIAQRCLYGVDKNPLAAEMAKLSLWLLTLAKDKPFEFLDHSIRSGDSLVGLHNIDQLRYFSLKPDTADAVLFKGPLDSAVDEAIALRLKLEDLPTNTVEDVQRQERLLAEANEKIARLRCAADLLVSAEFWGENAKDKLERTRHAAVKCGYYVDQGPTAEFEQVAAKERRGQTMFHWPLEFPEVVVKRKGFDAIIGNPPFVGGQRLTGSLGVPYREFLVDHIGRGRRGSADLCSYFFLNAARLLRVEGGFGLVATNTISQGDTREVGLDQVCGDGFTIPRAVASRPWPGVASLEVAYVWGRKGPWHGSCVLDETPTHGISSFLTAPGAVTGTPYRLKANEGKSFIGTYVLGMGFVLTPEEAQQLIAKDPRNKDVLFPYLNGEDLNSRPDQSPSRWVINFFDWPIEKAMEYPDCFRIMEEKVKPERMQLKDNNDGRRRKAYWWQYGRYTHGLATAIEGMQRVIVVSLVSNKVPFAIVSSNHVFAHKLAVFAFDSNCDIAILQSSFHYHWAWQYSSTMRCDLNYSPSDCFETYPRPNPSSAIATVWSNYNQIRGEIMQSRQQGLTKTYNRFHNPSEASADIRKLRELHIELDHGVAAAYGWTDLELGHGFHETKQGVRFTISEPARREVLQRLLKLNHERYAEEVRQGLHDKKKGSKTRPAKPAEPASTKKQSKTQGRLFGEDAP